MIGSGPLVHTPPAPPPIRLTLAWRWLGLGLALWAWLLVGLTGPASAQPAPDRAALLAELELEAGFASLDDDHAGLLAIADEGLQLDPDRASMIAFKIKALRGLGRDEAALQFMRGLWDRDPQRYAYLRFEAGYIRVNAKQYDKALTNFRIAEEVDRQRAIQEQVNTYVAMSDLDKALEAASRLDPKSAPSWLSQAQVRLLRKEFAQARQAIKTGLAADPGPEQAKALSELLQGVDQAERAARPWRLSTTQMIQYEDNVFRDPLQNNPAQAPTRQKGDFSWMARLDLDYNLGRGENTSWGMTSQLMSMEYLRLRDANFASVSLGAYWEYQTPGWGIRLPYEFGFFMAKAALLKKVEVHSLSPNLRLQHSDNWRTDLHGLIQFKNYLDRDPNVVAERLGLVHYLSTDTSLRQHMRLGYALSQDQTADDQSGFLTGEVSLGGATPLWGPLSLDLSLTYVRYLYQSRIDPYMPQGGETIRKDHQYRLSAQVFYRMSDQVMLALGYSYTFNDSNLADSQGYGPYDFERNVLFCFLNWVF